MSTRLLTSGTSVRERKLMLPLDRPITPADYPNIENVVKKAVKEKQNFERLELPKEALLEMFAVSLVVGVSRMAKTPE